MTTNALKTNIWKYAVFMIANKRVYVAILGAYYLTIPNVTPKGIGIILLAGSLAGFLFEIPSGYFSDKIGHKRALILSRIFLLFSTLFFLFATNIMFLIFGAIFLSIGIAFLSGTGSAFMYETFQGLNREDDYTKVMGKIRSIGFAVPVVLTTIIPFLVNISYKLPFVIALVIDIIGIFTAMSFVVPKVKQEHIKEIWITNFKQILSEGYKLGFLKFAIFNAIIGSVFYAIGGFRAPYQSFLEIPVIYYGILFGIGRGIASVMLAYSGFIKKIFNIVSFYKFRLVLYSILILTLALTSNIWITMSVFIMINALIHGLSQVNTGFVMEVIKNSKFKATLLSTQSQMKNIFSAITGFTLAFIIDKTTYKFGFLCLGICFVIITTPLYIYIKNKYKPQTTNGEV